MITVVDVRLATRYLVDMNDLAVYGMFLASVQVMNKRLSIPSRAASLDSQLDGKISVS